MTPKYFTEEILNPRIDAISNILAKKAHEYAQDNDRLHNFKVAARIKDESPEKALWGMSTKHLVAIIDMVEGRLKPTEFMINEKIGDMINYLILLEALLKEKNESNI